MPDEIDALELEPVQELLRRIRQRIERGIGDRLRRTAMAWQVERVDRPGIGDGVDVEKPVVEVAAEAVDQHDRIAAARTLCIAKVAAPRLDALVGWFRSLLDVAGRRNLEGLDIGVDLGVADLRRRQDAKQRLDRIDLPDLADAAPEQPAIGGFHRIGDLLRLDVHDLLAGLDRLPFLDVPGRERSLLHGEAPFRHDERRDGLAHRSLTSPCASGSTTCAPPRRSLPRSEHRDPRATARMAPAYAER